MEIFSLFSTIILFNLLIFLNFERISKGLFFFDKPDGKLKNHKNPVSIAGGFIILINLYLIFFIIKILNLDDLIFNNNFLNIIFILGSIFFVIGFIDDFKNLSPNIKLFLIIISIFFVTFFFPEIKLESIKISFLKNHYSFGNLSFIFTLLSFALLANAINMFDGINLQLICFTLFIFVIFILKGFLPIFFILLSISLIFLGILNYQNKVFIGDGGCYLISSIIGATFIYQYKIFSNFLYGDQIFIILFIPAIDMLRLFIVRIIKKKHPFKGDLNHLHHIIDSFIKNKNLTVLITLSLCIFPTLLMFLKLETYFILILNLILYLGLISFLVIKKKNYKSSE